MRFFRATEAGIFVAAAAGNTSTSTPTLTAGSVMNIWIATALKGAARLCGSTHGDAGRRTGAAQPVARRGTTT
jgi:hypothetical protein